MATTEQNTLLQTVDSAGNKVILYPVTMAENVVGGILRATVSVPASGWNGDGPYTQQIEVDGITASDWPHYGLVPGEDPEEDADAYGCIDVLETAEGAIQFTCLSGKPETDITIQLEVNR